MKRERRADALAVVLFFGLLPACSGPKAPEPLRRAVQAAVQMSGPGWLRQSAFFAIFPEGTPRQYVSFLFSDLGAAESPPVEGSGEIGPGEGKPGSASGLPVWPAGVAMTHTRPDPALGMQVVWKWDDRRRVIILEGYVDPGSAPVLVRERPFPSPLAPSDLARLAAGANQESGGRAQAF